MKRMLSISEELSKQTDDYLDGRNFSQFICTLIKENLGLEKDVRLAKPSIPQVKSAIQRTDKIVKKISKGGMCPHMIASDGYCKKCANYQT